MPAYVLTETQKMQIRKFCGYTNWGEQPNAGMGWRAWETNAYLEQKMNALTPEEGDRVVNLYIPNCLAMETNIQNVSQLLLVDTAAVFIRNKLQLKENIQLYNYWRLQLCQFLGIGPGEFFGGSRNSRMVV